MKGPMELQNIMGQILKKVAWLLPVNTQASLMHNMTHYLHVNNMGDHTR